MNENNVPAGYKLVSGYAYGQNYVSLYQSAEPTDKCLMNAYELGNPPMFAFLTALAAAPVAQPPAEVQVVGEASERDWELTCDECAGTGKVEVSEALHVDGRYMGEQFLREACNTCTGYGFTICLADIPKEIQQ